MRPLRILVCIHVPPLRHLAHLQKVVWHKHFIDRLAIASNQTHESEVERRDSKSLSNAYCIPNIFEHTNA